MRSKLPQFQTWVTCDLLPKIRKMGQERALREYTDRLEQERERSSQTQLRLEQEQKDREQIQLELEKARRRELTLRDFCASFEPIKCDHRMYIATSKAYARQHRFKVGGVHDVSKLRARLANYNTAHVDEDRMFFVALLPCSDFHSVESRFFSLFKKFKDKTHPLGETIHMNFKCLQSALEFVVENENREVEWFNEKCQIFIDATVEDADPELPPEVDLPKRELSLTDGARTESVDISSWTQEQKDAAFARFLDLARGQVQTGEELVWTQVVHVIQREHGARVKIMPIKKAFKSWAVDRKLRLRGLNIAG
jgi:hypothetical protein